MVNMNYDLLFNEIEKEALLYERSCQVYERYLFYMDDEFFSKNLKMKSYFFTLKEFS